MPYRPTVTHSHFFLLPFGTSCTIYTFIRMGIFTSRLSFGPAGATGHMRGMTLLLAFPTRGSRISTLRKLFPLSASPYSMHPLALATFPVTLLATITGRGVTRFPATFPGVRYPMLSRWAMRKGLVACSFPSALFPSLSTFASLFSLSLRCFVAMVASIFPFRAVRRVSFPLTAGLIRLTVPLLHFRSTSVVHIPWFTRTPLSSSISPLTLSSTWGFRLPSL